MIEPTNYKAKLVAQGYTQVEGVDYNEVFSQVVKYTSIRLFLSMVAHNGYENNFYIWRIWGNIYMMQREGYQHQGKEEQVCLLDRSLYGFKPFLSSGAKDLIASLLP